MRVVELKATSGLPSAIASPDLRRERAYRKAVVRLRCLYPSKKLLSESVERLHAMGKRNLARVLALKSRSTRKAGGEGQGKKKVAATVGGSRVADGS